MSVKDDRPYSTLEPAQPHSGDLDSEKQVVPDAGKQFKFDSSEGLQPASTHDCSEKEAQDLEKPPVDTFLAAKRHPSRSRTLWLVIGAIVLIAALLGGVLGGVLGSRRSSSVTNSADEHSRTRWQRDVAAISYTEGPVNYTRVYFQDNGGQLMEAAWQSNQTTWTTRGLGMSAKNRSAIAAAVSRPGRPLYNASTETWKPGTLSEQSSVALTNSSLAAMFDWCKTCGNTTIVAFQTADGTTQIGNLTSNGWTVAPMGLALQAPPGSGLALYAFYSGGGRDRIFFFYQKLNLNLAFAYFEPPRKNSTLKGWIDNSKNYGAVPLGSPIAAASSYNLTANGNETWAQVLSMNDTGIRVNTWMGIKNGWTSIGQQPPSMSNVTLPAKSYDSVAVTSIGMAFAPYQQEGQADAIASWQVIENAEDWQFLGNVEINGAWDNS